MGPRVLVLGGGGREAALAWALSRSPQAPVLLAAPGNPGLAPWAGLVPGLDPMDGPAVAAWCREQGVDLVVVGPETPLVAGVVDHLAAAGIAAFGPARAAAALEGSKAWAKAFMVRHGVPTAPFGEHADLAAALAHLGDAPHRFVIKADGLAAGKGVVLPDTLEEAREALAGMLDGSAFGAAGRTVVVEERLEGPEISVFALCDGARGWILGSARDHKRVGEGDAGPNTGGMGAVSPSPLETPERLAEVRARILEPVLAGMAAEGRPYRGVLYLGLMWTADGPRVIEFNCRLGDPETQALLPRLRIDLLDWCGRIARGGALPASPPEACGPETAVCLVLAAAGYPGPARRGDPIHGLEELAGEPGLHVFHAGTARDGAGRLVTAGGRVLGVTALAADAPAARERALAAAARVSFAGMHYRRDIGA